MERKIEQRINMLPEELKPIKADIVIPPCADRMEVDAYLKKDVDQVVKTLSDELASAREKLHIYNKEFGLPMLALLLNKATDQNDKIFYMVASSSSERSVVDEFSVYNYVIVEASFGSEIKRIATIDYASSADRVYLNFSDPTMDSIDYCIDQVDLMSLRIKNHVYVLRNH